MRIALVQCSMSENPEDNLVKTLSVLSEAAAGGASAVLFPEIQFTPFFPQYPGRDVSRYALPIEHEFVEHLQEQCRRLGVTAFPNFYLSEGGRCFDASPVINSDGSILGISKMVHVVQADPWFYEQDYYTPSDTGFQVFDTAVVRAGVVICFDRHYPESIRSCTLKGAELIVIPTANTKDEPADVFEWELRIAAIQNGVFIAMCNRVGVEDKMYFCGESMVVDPNGKVISKAGDGEQILYADLDLGLIAEARRERPYLALRRGECFER